MSIYTEMVQAGIETDHHESDLYVPDCPESRAILANHGINIGGRGVIQFIDNINGEPWLDIPFQYHD
jgi:hypothetical protein